MRTLVAPASPRTAPDRRQARPSNRRDAHHDAPVVSPVALGERRRRSDVSRPIRAAGSREREGQSQRTGHPHLGSRPELEARPAMATGEPGVPAGLRLPVRERGPQRAHPLRTAGGEELGEPTCVDPCMVHSEPADQQREDAQVGAVHRSVEAKSSMSSMFGPGAARR